MNKKYFFFDIDGTLTDVRTGKLVESAKTTISKLQEQGHFVAIATGRALYKTRAIAKEAGIHHIVSNGGAALTIGDELIENSPLDKQKAVALCREIESLGYGLLISPSDSIDVIMNNDDFIKQMGYRLEPTRYFLQKDIQFEDIEHIYKIYGAVPKEKEHELTLLDSIGHIRFQGDYLVFQQDQKDKGIEKMIKKVNGSLEDVVVFGDDYNDLVMFHDEWTCIAMNHAPDKLKEKADFVTKDSHEDGIEYACRHFQWI